MIESIVLVFGMGLVAFIILIFMALLDKEHIVLRILLSFFIFFIIILMSKGILDANKDCSILPANETIINESITSYSYKQVCYDTGKNTSLTFYRAALWIMILYFLYILIYLNYFIWIERIFKDWGFIKEKK